MIPHDTYAYTEDDARATLRHGPALIDLLVEGVEPAALAPVASHLERERARVQEAIEDTSSSLADRLGAVLRAHATAASIVRGSGAFGLMARGTVAHLSRGGGGVPKTGCDAIEVGWDGVVGDVQADRKNHGRPWQALCLWSSEVIDAFVADGHDLAPGRAGENVTISGIPWDRVRPGSVLELGEVAAQVWAPATPCRKNAAWFRDGRVDLMHHRHGPVSRMYASVLQPGTIRVGDRATVHRSAGPTPTFDAVDELDAELATQVRALLDAAFGDAFDEEDWQHALGGHHVLGRFPDGSLLAHAAVVPRTIHVGGRAVRAGYVEAVATDPDHHGRSFGSQAIEVVGKIIHAHHELGVLSTGIHRFYERHRWERWRGPTFVRRAGGLERTEDADAGVMVLRTDATTAIDLTEPIACEERAGDDW